MKKIVFLLTIFFMIGQQMIAKDKTPKSAEERAEKITKKLTEKLALTAEQATKVKAISLTKAQKMDQAKSKAGADDKKKNTEFKLIKQQWESDLKAILTPQQFESYLKYKEEKKAQKKAGNTDKSNKGGASKSKEDTSDNLD